MQIALEQQPATGRHVLAFCGDTLEFTLKLDTARPGHAFLRTNIGQAAAARDEIIRETLHRQLRLAEDWFDIPMTRVNEQLHRLTMPLIETGHFEAKAFFLPEGEQVPRWPQGPNTVVNVHPAEYCCANTLYNAFVRQFGPGKCARRAASAAQVKSIQALGAEGYAVIPPSGTFRDLVQELDFIIGRLGCRNILLLPIHPTPTVYGRMGLFGSPYAALDFTEVDPALAQFDRRATPLEQFQELADAVHARGARLFLDIAINHTGWAAKIHSLHPDWLVREADGAIRSPGAWGVTWEDLAELNHNHRELWHYLAEIFSLWCRRGVDGFRCDAGYMIPLSAWEFIVATVRREFPDTLFLLEGLGGRIETTVALLNVANLNWAYSELFQNYDRPQIEAYLPAAVRISESDGLLIHFAETHDNDRLAARSPAFARMRTTLSALGSSNGAFAFANGVEWFATDKIDIHGCSSLNWNSAENQVEHIARLARILGAHPAFFNGARLRLIHQSAANGIALLRRQPAGDKRVLVVVNLDDRAPSAVTWSADEAGLPPDPLDLLTGRKIAVSTRNGLSTVELAPGEALCLTPEPRDLELIAAAEKLKAEPPARVRRQCLRAWALEAARPYCQTNDLTGLDPEKLADDLAANPRAFCRGLNPHNADVTDFEWPRDLKREVPVPPDHFLLIRMAHPFRAQIFDGHVVLRQKDALRQADGRYFILFCPPAAPSAAEPRELRLSVFKPDGVEHATGHLLFLPPGEDLKVKTTLYHNEIQQSRAMTLASNGRGGMLRAGVRWPEIYSRYDALLAGNLSPEYPEDRRIMLTRCRTWLVYRGYSQDITADRLLEFAQGANSGRWRFRVPFGHGQLVYFEIVAEMLAEQNAVRLTFNRLPADPARACLADENAATLIVRPDIEDRSFHDTTKAFIGPENAWPRAVNPVPRGFMFAANPDRRLRMTASAGVFQVEPEWQYMIHRPVEAERGLDAASDLFSPGYFKLELKGGEQAQIVAQILTPRENEEIPVPDRPLAMQRTQAPAAHLPLLTVLEQAMRHFIVRRGELKTVIAGYPWFLDWGRDTLICARGLISAGRLEEVGAILKQFARFEKDGTLPNMIHGENASNRDTSDAPLWLFTACADWCRATGDRRLLDEKCGNKTMRQALEAIAAAYMRGTPNGIVMDGESALIFSPTHFTWMDTQHPAGTPRAGYPIEIQALWFAALAFLADTDTPGAQWRELAARVADSIVRYFWNPARGWLADCLHAAPGTAAAKAAPDDALRPNQLLALTLGAIRDQNIGERMLSACAELLIPGAIRTLADRQVDYPLPIYRDGKLINDPPRPYWGRYEGDEDGRRKPAYHNGTAWTWLFPSYCEAWDLVYRPGGRRTALALLGSSLRIINRGCLGQIPEILDGDWPHQLRGCDAQAWGVTELYRVLKLLQ